MYMFDDDTEEVLATNTDCYYTTEKSTEIKNMNDIYDVLVDIRNISILLCFIVFVFEAHKLLTKSFRRQFKC